MKKFGIIGYPLGHSFSKGWFSRLFAERGFIDCAYENYPLTSIGELPDLIARTPDLRGFNVTIPYKEAVIPYLDELDPQAREVGAVNCVRIGRANGGLFLKGYNTDVYGFRHTLLALLGTERPGALILGTGGASKAVGYVLAQVGIDFRFVSRSGQGEILSYDGLTPEFVASRRLIINTTPLGMSPRTDTLPAIPYEAVGSSHILYDLVYNPAETAFLHQGRLRGATVVNGYAMLVGQAEQAWNIWNDF